MRASPPLWPSALGVLRRAVRVAYVAGLLGWAAPSAAADLGGDFRSLLADAGVSEAELDDVRTIEAPLSSAESAIISRVLFRLNDVETGALLVDAAPPSATASLEPGQLIQLEGRAVGLSEIPAGIGSTAHSPHGSLYRIEVSLKDDSRAFVYTAQVPRAWTARSDQPDLSEPSSFKAVYLGASNEGAAVYLASRVCWRPVANVPAGVKWLSGRGYDAALLDAVQQRGPFATHDGGFEAKAFYGALALLSAADPAELAMLARESVAARAEHWANESPHIAAQRRELSQQLGRQAPSAAPDAAERLRALQRQEAMGRQVARRAEQGLSSVWPMFLDAERQVGEMFLLEGTARRAVRIVVDQPAAGLKDYYEVDLFTTDSQNQPIICCVATLPGGFPTGDVIREPVQVAGIFFKRWAYTARPPLAPADAPAQQPARLAPPLVLAATASWLRTEEQPGASRGLAAGVAIVVGAAVVAAVLAAVARRDRLARTRRARYDAGPEGLAGLESEPPASGN